MAEEIDFEEQLEQEKRQQVEEEEKEAATVGLNYTDSDGTVMEWDPIKRAFFPKIDMDFIARYQMNYGTDTTGTYKCSKEGATGYEKKFQQSNTGTDREANYQVHYSCDHGKDNTRSLLNLDYEQKQTNEEEEEEEEDTVKADESTEKKGKRKKKGTDKGDGKHKPPEEAPTWFDVDSEKSTHVYVSGLPSDITEEEFKELMSKYGLIMFDPITHKPKLKLYVGPNGKPKGDGLCCYIKQESVDLALKLLDGYQLGDSTISVERAKFQLKGEYDPAKKKKKLSNKMKRKLKEKQQKLFDWRPDIAPDTRPRHERIVILKHMFDVKEFEDDPTLINELREDVQSECAKFGEVRKVQVYDRHKDGVISVTFKTPEEADVCVAAMKGRWFAKRQIVAETYDGKTKYDVHETDAEKEERLQHWESFLEDGSSKAKVTSDKDNKQVTAGGQSLSTAAGNAASPAIVGAPESAHSAAPGEDSNSVPCMPGQGAGCPDSASAASDTWVSSV